MFCLLIRMKNQMDFNFNPAQNSFKELHLIGFNLQIFVWHRINAEQLCRVVNYDSKVFIKDYQCLLEASLYLM